MTSTMMKWMLFFGKMGMTVLVMKMIVVTMLLLHWQIKQTKTARTGTAQAPVCRLQSQKYGDDSKAAGLLSNNLLSLHTLHAEMCFK